MIAVMKFAFARVGTVVVIRLENYYPEGKRESIHMHGKASIRHKMPEQVCRTCTCGQPVLSSSVFDRASRLASAWSAVR